MNIPFTPSPSAGSTSQTGSAHQHGPLRHVPFVGPGHDRPPADVGPLGPGGRTPVLRPPRYAPAPVADDSKSAPEYGTCPRCAIVAASGTLPTRVGVTRQQRKHSLAPEIRSGHPHSHGVCEVPCQATGRDFRMPTPLPVRSAGVRPRHGAGRVTSSRLQPFHDVRRPALPAPGRRSRRRSRPPERPGRDVPGDRPHQPKPHRRQEPARTPRPGAVTCGQRRR